MIVIYLPVFRDKTRKSWGSCDNPSFSSPESQNIHAGKRFQTASSGLKKTHVSFMYHVVLILGCVMSILTEKSIASEVYRHPVPTGGIYVIYTIVSDTHTQNHTNII